MDRGYDRTQVEEFFDRAKQVWDAGGPPGAVSSWHIRTVGFDLRRDGYSVPDVDAALDRIEDAFAQRELRYDPVDAAEVEHAIMQVLSAPDGERFPRESGLRLGYRRRDVDRLCRAVYRHLVHGAALEVDDVRRAVFRAGHGGAGYREAAVDLFCDQVVDVMRRRALQLV
jgi:DivIVA domain-containing protein